MSKPKKLKVGQRFLNHYTKEICEIKSIKGLKVHVVFVGGREAEQHISNMRSCYDPIN